MGNVNDPVKSNYILNKKTLFKLELQVLLFSGLDIGYFTRYDVPVGEFEGEPVTIRTIIISDKHMSKREDGIKREKLVLMHGYAGAGALFFAILKRLVSHFDVILIDMIGQGGSSRPNDYDYENITPEESIKYFVDYFEKWRKAMKRFFYRFENKMSAAHYAKLSE